MKYPDSEQYQKEIAEQYKKRIQSFSNSEVIEILLKLGFKDVEKIEKAGVGNMNATFVTNDLVVKVKNDKEHPYFLANKIASDKLSGQYPVVSVLAYDFYQKTQYEVLVMERTKGDILIDTILDLDQNVAIEIFRQVLGVVKQLFNIKFTEFGWINIEPGSRTYFEFLTEEFNENTQ